MTTGCAYTLFASFALHYLIPFNVPLAYEYVNNVINIIVHTISHFQLGN